MQSFGNVLHVYLFSDQCISIAFLQYTFSCTSLELILPLSPTADPWNQDTSLESLASEAVCHSNLKNSSFSPQFCYGLNLECQF